MNLQSEETENIAPNGTPTKKSQKSMTRIPFASINSNIHSLNDSDDWRERVEVITKDMHQSYIAWSHEAVEDIIEDSIERSEKKSQLEHPVINIDCDGDMENATNASFTALSSSQHMSMHDSMKEIASDDSDLEDVEAKGDVNDSILGMLEKFRNIRVCHDDSTVQTTPEPVLSHDTFSADSDLPDTSHHDMDLEAVDDDKGQSSKLYYVADQVASESCPPENIGSQPSGMNSTFSSLLGQLGNMKIDNDEKQSTVIDITSDDEDEFVEAKEDLEVSLTVNHSHVTSQSLTYTPEVVTLDASKEEEEKEGSTVGEEFEDALSDGSFANTEGEAEASVTQSTHEDSILAFDSTTSTLRANDTLESVQKGDDLLSDTVPSSPNCSIVNSAEENLEGGVISETKDSAQLCTTVNEQCVTCSPNFSTLNTGEENLSGPIITETEDLAHLSTTVNDVQCSTSSLNCSVINKAEESVESSIIHETEDPTHLSALVDEVQYSTSSPKCSDVNTAKETVEGRIMNTTQNSTHLSATVSDVQCVATSPNCSVINAADENLESGVIHETEDSTHLSAMVEEVQCATSSPTCSDVNTAEANLEGRVMSETQDHLSVTNSEVQCATSSTNCSIINTVEENLESPIIKETQDSDHVSTGVGAGQCPTSSSNCSVVNKAEENLESGVIRETGNSFHLSAMVDEVQCVTISPTFSDVNTAEANVETPIIHETETSTHLSTLVNEVQCAIISPTCGDVNPAEANLEGRDMSETQVPLSATISEVHCATSSLNCSIIDTAEEYLEGPIVSETDDSARLSTTVNKVLDATSSPQQTPAESFATVGDQPTVEMLHVSCDESQMNESLRISQLLQSREKVSDTLKEPIACQEVDPSSLNENLSGERELNKSSCLHSNSMSAQIHDDTPTDALGAAVTSEKGCDTDPPKYDYDEWSTGSGMRVSLTPEQLTSIAEHQAHELTTLTSPSSTVDNEHKSLELDTTVHAGCENDETVIVEECAIANNTIVECPSQSMESAADVCSSKEAVPFIHVSDDDDLFSLQSDPFSEDQNLDFGNNTRKSLSSLEFDAISKKACEMIGDDLISPPSQPIELTSTENDDALDSFVDAADFFGTSENLDMLESFGGGSKRANLAKNSLFVSFDPLVANRDSIAPFLQIRDTDNISRKSALISFSPKLDANKENKCEETLVKINDSNIFDQTLCSNDTTVPVNVPPPKSVSMENHCTQTESNVITQVELAEILQKIELKHQDALLRKAKEISELTNKYETTIEENEENSRAMNEESENKIRMLRKLLAEMKNMFILLKDKKDALEKELQGEIFALQARMEQIQAKHDQQLTRCRKELEEKQSDISAMENSWFGLVKQCDRMNEVIASQRRNEEILKEEMIRWETKLKDSHQQTDQLVASYEEQLKRTGAELDDAKCQMEADAKRSLVMMKKAELKIATMKESILHKDNEIARLHKVINDFGSDL